ncbi:MAG TPA: phosphatase PAP2 family protein [Gammaproteobacteria bacterium]
MLRPRLPFPVLLLTLLAAGCASRPTVPVKAHTQGGSPLERLVAHSIEDHRRHYDTESLLALLPPLAVAGSLANTNADRWIRDTLQNDVRAEWSNDISRAFLDAGDVAQNRFSVPLYALTMLAGDYTGNAKRDSPLATWAERSFRANVLGGPQAWALTYILGSHRPDAGDSNWKPWNDNDGVSGHSFYGAVPFLTAARMSDSTGWRYTFYALSVLPAFSRLNDNQHYASQAVTGWWLAWLATGTVAESASDGNRIRITPLLAPGGGYVMVNLGF